MGRGGMGQEMTIAAGTTTMTITRITTVAKEEVIRSWRLWERTGCSSFGRAAKKEEEGIMAKSG